MKFDNLLQKDCKVSLEITPLELKEAFTEWAEDFITRHKEKESKAKEETYLSSKETMIKLDCSQPTLWRWKKKGYLVPVKIGAKVMYRQSDIQKILMPLSK